MRYQRDARDGEELFMEELIKVEPTTGLKILPHWLAQPYFRVQPTPTGVKPGLKRSYSIEADRESEGEGHERREAWQEGTKRVNLMPAAICSSESS